MTRTAETEHKPRYVYSLNYSDNTPFYFGRCVNIKDRFRLHKIAAKNNRCNPELCKIINHEVATRGDDFQPTVLMVAENEHWGDFYEKKLIEKHLSKGLKLANQESGGTKGFKCSDTTKKKISEAKYKKVVRFTLDDIMIQEYGSVTEAAKDVGVSRSTISGACLGLQKTSAGFKWKFAKDILGYV